MARTSKSRGTPMFKMRSGNKSTFKMMGSSSPVRQPLAPEEKITMGEEKIVGTTTTETPKSTDVKTDYQTKGTGYTPPSKLMPKDEWNKLSKEEQDAMDAKYIKEHTRDIVTERSETKSTPKELTPQEKMAKGVHHSKYYDAKSGEYRVRQYAFKNIGTEENPKYTSSGRGKQTGDISLDEWRETYGSVEKQRKTNPRTQL